MKVLQINSVCGIGSTGRIATDIDKLLNAKGYMSCVAYGRDDSYNCDTSIRIGSKFDNYMHGVITRLFDRHGFGSKRATKKFLAEIDKINPDIIHLHNIHGYFINIELLFDYLKKVNKPVIWTLHDCWAFTGHCSYFDIANCDRWQRICYDCPQRSDYPKSLFIDNSRDNFNRKRDIFTGVRNMTIVTPSKWLAGLVKKSYLSDYPVEVINNGIDLNIFQPVESEFRSKYNINDKFIILGIANIWDKRKGYKYFIDLSSRIGADEVIIMIGITEKQKQGLPDNIIGITRTNNIRELAEIYSAADVFVNPTLEDNFPTTNLESLACGTPVITFRTGGSIEAVDETCGIIVDKDDREQLLKAILEIKKNGKNSYSDMCLVRAKNLYDKDDRYGDYIELYRRQ